MAYTPFSVVYDSFLSKITDDAYMELTYEETLDILEDLLITAIQKFEFPRIALDNDLKKQIKKVKHPGTNEDVEVTEIVRVFLNELTQEQINILSTYMIVEWLGQQLASVQLVRMKYSGSDFKFTSQANHMQKLLQMKKDYEREGFHLQRLYSRRQKDSNGVYRSTFGKLMG